VQEEPFHIRGLRLEHLGEHVLVTNRSGSR
jgi:hypothetical protein